MHATALCVRAIVRTMMVMATKKKKKKRASRPRSRRPVAGRVPKTRKGAAKKRALPRARARGAKPPAVKKKRPVKKAAAKKPVKAAKKVAKSVVRKVAKRVPKKAAPVAKRRASRAPKTTVRRRDGSGHLDPQYAAELLERSGGNDREQPNEGFLTQPRSSDDLAENMGEEFIASATSGENQEEDLLDQVVPEERGGPFVPSTAGAEFAEGTDASNPLGSKKEPFPTT